MFDLKHRTALVTGAGRGIGRAIAITLAGAGAHVAVTARTARELEETVATIKQQGGKAVALSADLAAPGVPQQIAKDAAAQLGRIDILVNNAGIGSSSSPKPVVDFDDEFWELTLRLNLTAPYLLSKAVLPAMIQRKWGRIINVASINGRIPSPHAAAYVASKHGLLGLTKSMALEVARDGVTVNAINPGPVHTVMNDRRVAYDAQRRGVSFEELANSLTPMGRRLEPEDIGPLALYLASDQSASLTGQGINIDGGIAMT
jgi:NAD(P)-dependent dehydrogenase (short-subunit alcohol dehydrogenase family)